MAHGLTTLFGVHLVDGAGAVWIFFTISGFLITLALNKKYVANGGLAPFYWNRAIRLLPTYWLWLFVSTCFYLFVNPADFTYQAIHIGGAAGPVDFWQRYSGESSFFTLFLATFANAFGLFADGFLYSGIDPVSGNLIANPAQAAPIWAYGFIVIGQYWSIGVELIFYLVAPFFVTRLWRLGIVYVLAISGFAEDAWVTVASHLGLPSPIVFALAPKFMWMFMLGAVLSHAYIAWQDSDRKGLRNSLLLICAMYVLLAAKGPQLFPIANFPWWLFLVTTSFLPVLFHATRNKKWDRFLGDLSYPVYVNHFLIVQITGSFFKPSGWVFASIACLVASMLILLVERPMQRYKWAPKTNGQIQPK